MRIKVVEILDRIALAAATQDAEELRDLKAKLKAIDVYIQAPNVWVGGVIQLIDVILGLVTAAPPIDVTGRTLTEDATRPRGMEFDVGGALFHIAEAALNQDCFILAQIKSDFVVIEKWVHGTFNEPPSAFIRLIDSILKILPSGSAALGSTGP